jgi:hypothetical protein
VFREVPLLKVGVIMMVLALALMIAAVVVSVTLGSKPERMVAAEVAAKSPGEVPRNSSGEEGSATKNSSSQKESPHYPSGGESLRYGSSSSSGESVGQGKEEAKEPQAVLQQETEPSNSQSEMPLSLSPNLKSNLCQARKKGAGPSPPKERYGAPTEHVTTNCFPEP